MTPERIKELRAVIAAASPGPLTIAEKGTYPADEGATVLFPVLLSRLGVPIRICAAQYLTDDMAKFIVESHTALPSALDTIEAQQRRIEELEAALIAMRTVMDNGPMPKRLDDALTWRQCDERARAMCDAALQLKEPS